MVVKIPVVGYLSIRQSKVFLLCLCLWLFNVSVGVVHAQGTPESAGPVTESIGTGSIAISLAEVSNGFDVPVVTISLSLIHI